MNRFMAHLQQQRTGASTSAFPDIPQASTDTFGWMPMVPTTDTTHTTNTDAFTLNAHPVGPLSQPVASSVPSSGVFGTTVNYNKELADKVSSISQSHTKLEQMCVLMLEQQAQLLKVCIRCVSSSKKRGVQ
eukprot:TRINITY_DN35184_c0_g1_i2.p1 TRINITY_DN35184_c0_g1~~TRINITY_DN35184_c0_g1_i2.p1  ORF type:complete len:147 (-),score=17.08 TRINITY_DN35184_c0_g1_i2:10-402(-)